MVQLNEKQKKLLGTWKLESANNFDAYLQEIGIPAFQRVLANTIVPTITVAVDGDAWTVTMSSTFKCDEWKFKLGERFETTTVDGRKFWCVVDLTQDGKITETQSVIDGNSGVPSVISRFVDDNDKMHVQSAANGVECERIFVRV